MNAPLLLPVPRSLELSSGTLALPDPCTLAGSDGLAMDRVLESVVRRAGVRAVRGDSRASVRLVPGTGLPPEGHRVLISDSIELQAGDKSGLLWAATALDQLLSQYGRELPHLRIEDWPDFPVRGYMLDISRDRVPTSSWLHELVRTLSSLRFNQLQLYTEHTFAYREHEIVWRDASPLSPEDVRALDAHCRANGIELVPNQNSFGHMERWLRHPTYAPLGELGADEIEGRTPACLAPGAESAAFARGLYAELLPCFGSRTLNIGCDETAELGRGRSREACERSGRGRVYMDHLLGLIAGLQEEGYTVQFWADMVAQYPELIGELPRAGAIALAWGYEAPQDSASVPAEVLERLTRAGVDPENLLSGFEQRVRPFAAAGLPYFVCPGTSSWNSLVGRWPNARANLQDAAEVGLANGASGYLVTDWGDNGHLQPPSVSLAPIAYGAALAWCGESARSLELEGALDALLLDGEADGSAATLLQLGTLYEDIGLRSLNSTALFHGLLRPLGSDLPCWGQTDRPRLERVVTALDEARAKLGRDTALARELSQAAGLARHGARRLGLRWLDSEAERSRLREDLEELIEEQAAVWSLRSRTGGLSDSLERLHRALSDY